jgi:hypothetical protein
VVRGVEILLHISGAKQAIIAIEDDKPEAYQSLLMFNHNDKISLVQISTQKKNTQPVECGSDTQHRNNDIQYNLLNYNNMILFQYKHKRNSDYSWAINV